MKSKNTTIKVLVIVVLVLLSCAYLLPIYVMISTSLKSLAEINARTYLQISANLQFENYRKAFELLLLKPSIYQSPIINSTIVSVSVTVLAAFFGSLGGYYLSRSKTLFARILFVLVGIALYLPYQVVLIPLVTVVAKTGLALKPFPFGLILSYLILNVPLACTLMGTFFLSIPRELEEAAEVDGASRVQTFFQIVVPISMPAYASVAIILFTQVWNEFLLALTLASPETKTVQVALQEIKGSFIALYNIQMAGALITVMIPMLFFLLLGRYFVRGILAGALKG